MRVLAVPIIIFWGLLAVTTNTFIPKVEDVAAELAGSMIPTYAPSQVAMLHIGEKFQESTSTSLTMVVLEADRPLDDDDHRYYDDLMQRLKQDPEHVQYVMDLWGKPITAAGAQSVDGKATFVLLRLAGNIGQIQANESVQAVRDIIAHDTPPPGLKVYVSGAAPLASDTLSIANSSLNNITIVTIVLIVVMLLVVYRSASTLLVPLVSVLIQMLVAKGIIATLGHFGFIPLSSFAVNIVVALTLGAGTDYGIFLMGRYQEARQAGESREEAYYTAYRSVAPIIIGSGLTIAGAGLLPELRATGLLPHHGPGRRDQHAVHHRVGADARPGDTHVGQSVRPVRSQADGQGTCTGGSGECGAVADTHLRGQLRRRHGRGRSSCRPTGSATTTARTNRPTASANHGFAASDRHFSQSKLFSEMLMVESDHDMRNSADFISLDRVAKSLIRLPGVAMVQSITRPLGRPLEHATHPLPVHHPGQRQRPAVAVQRTAEREHRQTGRDPGRHRREVGKMHRPHPEDVRRTAFDGAHVGEPATGHRGDERRHLQPRRLPSATEELLLLGAALFRHSGCAGRSDRCSTRSTASTVFASRSATPSPTFRPSMRCCRS